MSNALDASLAGALHTTRPHSVFPLLIHSFSCLLVFHSIPFSLCCIQFFVLRLHFFFTRCENSCGACSTIHFIQFSVHFVQWCWYVCECVWVSHSHMMNCIHIENHANTYKHTDDDFIHCYHRWMWKPNSQAKQTKLASKQARKQFKQKVYSLKTCQGCVFESVSLKLWYLLVRISVCLYVIKLFCCLFFDTHTIWFSLNSNESAIESPSLSLYFDTSSLSNTFFYLVTINISFCYCYWCCCSFCCVWWSLLLCLIEVCIVYSIASEF